MAPAGPLTCERVSMCVSWSIPAGGDATLNIRVAGIRVGPDGRARSAEDLLSGAGRSIDLSLPTIEPAVHKVVFVVSAGGGDDPTFGALRDAIVWFAAQPGDSPIAAYDLSEEFPRARTLVPGDVVRTGTGWKYRAMGFVWDRDLTALEVGYGTAALT